MDMKYIMILQLNQCNIKQIPVIFYINIYFKEEIYMFKFLAKVAEKYAKATNTACIAFAIFHQPKMTKSMIRKD